MTLNEYQALAQRTSHGHGGGKVENGVLGLCGESGECADIWKKYMHQGHEFDRAHMMEELGDVLWYVAELASGLGVTLEDVAQHNIDKLRKRYPDGFDPERSRNREAEQPVGKTDTSETLEEMARRLCNFRGCNGCLIGAQAGSCVVFDIANADEDDYPRHTQISTLRKWAAENPPERER